MKSHLSRRFPLALGALGCALTLASCTPMNDTNEATPNKEVIGGNDVIPNAANAVEPTSDDNDAPPSAVEFAALETIYVPGKDDLLHSQKVSRQAIDSQLKSGDRAAPGLQEIIEKAPDYYPKGAKINSTTQTKTGLTVDLNQAFANDEFWRTKGEKMTELAVYAMVNSAAKTTSAKGTSDPQPVTFTVEKKTAQTLGEFGIDEELEPETRLIAPK